MLFHTLRNLSEVVREFFRSRFYWFHYKAFSKCVLNGTTVESINSLFQLFLK